MDEFSKEFEEEFMKLMRTRCCSLSLHRHHMAAALSLSPFTPCRTAAYWITGPHDMQEVILTYNGKAILGGIVRVHSA